MYFLTKQMSISPVARPVLCAAPSDCWGPCWWMSHGARNHTMPSRSTPPKMLTKSGDACREPILLMTVMESHSSSMHAISGIPALYCSVGRPVNEEWHYLVLVAGREVNDLMQFVVTRDASDGSSNATIPHQAAPLAPRPTAPVSTGLRSSSPSDSDIAPLRSWEPITNNTRLLSHIVLRNHYTIMIMNVMLNSSKTKVVK